MRSNQLHALLLIMTGLLASAMPVLVHAQTGPQRERLTAMGQCFGAVSSIVGCWRQVYNFIKIGPIGKTFPKADCCQAVLETEAQCWGSYPMPDHGIDPTMTIMLNNYCVGIIGPEVPDHLG
ncbi:hypothetical protein AMTR_s00017p00134300 [Amborella trichopoda]|uniref:Prolamin-like domain-containing protein n=1 Tax=Amborella trichopoda TaxID=13333 RepID=W1PKK8_AMBTC|nr:hypothetical protein AMTR_s00017p00134300 [Amborella trichopoda]